MSDYKDRNGNQHFQPYELVESIPRQDDPLMAIGDVKIYVGVLANKLRESYLYGGRYCRYKEMCEPQHGDVVFVADAYRSAVDLNTRLQAVGYYLGAREEWASTDAEWEAHKVEDPTITDEMRAIELQAHYIQFGPDNIARWTNCDVMKVTL